MYHGIRTDHGSVVAVEDADGGHGLDPRFDLRTHADGFNWGYGGSGPAQLALALCCDALGDDDRALAVYQKFKFAGVGPLAGPGWTLTAAQVRAAVADIERVQARLPNRPADGPSR